jgi:ribosome maturation factor RimP
VGYARFFCFWSQWMDATTARIWELATPLAHARGMEIIDVEFRREGGRGGRTLRLFLDKEGGAILDELSQVSRELSEILDGEDIIDEAYTLEVSSPGINRPLKRPEHFAQFIGKRIRVRTRDMINGRRSFLGRLLEVSTGNISLEQDGTRCEIPFEQIEKSNYEHDWSAPYAAGSK